MVHALYYLYCTNCTREYKEAGESIREVRKFAKDNSWKYMKVPNGSYWDICPTCLPSLNALVDTYG